ncbi:MAG: hypothetical protein JSV91_00365 [Phycisphaerales bacterium]|nr:MAG: hypothetical protein JSV91_00365 [Phycisphaerales bacterium]
MCREDDSTAVMCRAALLLIVLWWSSVVGCGPKPSALLKAGATHVPAKPYENRLFIKRSPEAVYSALLAVLDENAAMVSAADADRGLLAWCDRSGLFHPLTPDRPESTTYTSRTLGSLEPSRFHGVVYACARLRAHSGGTVFRLHATRRDERPWILAYSNGDYERYIFRCLTAQLDRMRRSDGQGGAGSRGRHYTSPSQTTPLEGATAGRGAAHPSGDATDYGGLYLRHLGDVRIPPTDRIRETGLHEVYPVAVDRFWSACLDVVWQYDAVAKLDRASRIVVFSHGTALPTEADSEADAARYCNALLVVLAESRGSSATDVYLAWLPPDSLVPTAIEPPSEEMVKNIAEAVKTDAHRITAAKVAGQFYGHLSTQLFWDERWLEKLQRRRTEEAAVTR